MAIEMAQFYRADITLLHVLARGVKSQPDADRVVEWTKSEMQRMVPEEAPLWTHVTVQVEIGDVVGEVLNVAKETSADLILLGVNSDVGFWPIRGDDTVYGIIAEARSPVLSIRHAAGGGN
jgi:nucleotide-binding universal stress UspA family protein